MRKLKLVVISGCNRGLGYGIAKCFANKGFRVVGLNKTLCNENWMTEIKCNILNKDEIDSAVKKIVSDFGKIDILVNNAGIRRFGNISEISEEDWEVSLETNLTAPLRLLQKTSEHLSKSNGIIFFIGSHAGEHFYEESVAYSSTKAALHAMAEVAVKDLRYKGIRVCCLSLGAISNIKMEDDDWKMKPSDVGELLVLLESLPKRVMPAYVEMRPSKPSKSPITGMEYLQFI
ncbi:SDR family NAD(P)-dependent oxidoreductase [Paenibacillus polymyxa]|uniref:SDR family NAD(P)-dependent oxidoreductase n=1 Tax=Paenibacillus polymyxa TaxID=1406 RepID=UPI00307E65F7